jgi:nucleoside phosphorylase/CheY-like chemotaxis protein
MKTLIVDDQYEKVEVFGSILKDLGCQDFEQATCSRDALTKMRATNFDLLILDLQIPEALGEPVNPVGGKELLKIVNLNENIQNPTHVVAITSHQESYDLCSDYFYQQGWTLILGFDDKEYLASIIKSKMNHCVPRFCKYDVAIITALEHTELKAVLKLPCSWTAHQPDDDCNIYHTGTVNVKSGEIKTIITTSCPRIGMASAASVAMKLCVKYNPDYLIMTGILAGIEGKVEMGDILVADPCWDWGSGKLTIKDGEVKFLSSPYQIQLDSRLQSIVKKISAERTYLDELYCSWKETTRPSHDLNLHVGPIATGAVVLEDPNTVDNILVQNRDTIGIEMEAYGVAAAAKNASSTPPKTLIIKSVCDFADPHKGDKWQKYAAYTSSSIAFKLIQEHLFSN